jgi:hypothetical protein
LFCIFGYLKEHPKDPPIDEQRLKKYDWHDFYRGVKEAIPGDMMLEPRGKSMSKHHFVDADLAGNAKPMRSQIGILIFCNMVLVV